MRSDPSEQRCFLCPCCARANREQEALQASIAAYQRIWWMAERYADASGSGGPEWREMEEARHEIEQAITRALKSSPSREKEPWT